MSFNNHAATRAGTHFSIHTNLTLNKKKGLFHDNKPDYPFYFGGCSLTAAVAVAATALVGGLVDVSLLPLRMA